MQIPIETNSAAHLVISNTERIEDFEVPDKRFISAKNWREEGIQESTMHAWLTKFVRANSDRIRVYTLEAGHLYHFDTTKLHSVYNFGATGRLTLAADLVANDWLKEWFPEMSFGRTHWLKAAGGKLPPALKQDN